MSDEPPLRRNEAGPADAAPSRWLAIDQATFRKAVNIVRYRMMARRERAEDAVVDALMKLDRLRPRVQNVLQLLAKAACNEFRTVRRLESDRIAQVLSTGDIDHYAQTPAGGAEADDPCDILSHVERLDERARRTRSLSAVLVDLPEADRELLFAHYVNGQQLLAIDAERGDSPGTAKTQLHRLRARLRARAFSRLRSEPSR